MATPNKPSEMSEAEAYRKLQEALAKGQAGLDALSPEVKKLAMGPAAESVKDVGQETFLKEMREAEAKGDLPSVTVMPDTGMEVVQDPTETGKTPKQVYDHLESQREKAYLATEKAYGYEDYEKAPAWLRDGLRDIGIIGLDEEVVSADGYEDPSRSLRMLELVGQGRRKYRDPKVQQKAMALYRRFKSDPSYDDYFGYNTENQQRLLREEFPQGERHSSSDPIIPPPPPEETDFGKREDYKGFRKPRGMSADQEAAWKAGIDDRLLDEGSRIEERIDAEHPVEQAKDFFKRLGEGDIEAWKDAGYYGLNAAALSPVGQIPQAGADIGVAGIDAARGDYTGAAISGAAVVLPVTAAMLKGAIRNPIASKLISKLDDVDPHIAGAPGDPDEYMRHLELKGFSDDVAKLSDDELAEAYKSLGRANIAIRKGPQRSARAGGAEELVGKREIPSDPYAPSPAEADALDSIEEVYARTYATKELLKEEIVKRIGGDQVKNREWTKKLITPREELGKKQAAVDKSLSDALSNLKPETSAARLGVKADDPHDYLLDNSRKTGEWLAKRAESMKAAGGKETAESLELKEIADWQQYSWDPPSPRIKSLIEKHGTKVNKD